MYFYKKMTFFGHDNLDIIVYFHFLAWFQKNYHIFSNYNRKARFWNAKFAFQNRDIPLHFWFLLVFLKPSRKMKLPHYSEIIITKNQEFLLKIPVFSKQLWHNYQDFWRKTCIWHQIIGNCAKIVLLKSGFMPKKGPM